MIEYPKISGPFKRYTDGPKRNQVMPGVWSFPELGVLEDVQGWTFQEKIDGTNVRVHWDGHKVTFGGRTDNAQMPVKLLDRLQMIFPETLMEQQFGAQEATIFGEGFGAKIQKVGSLYGDEQDFAMFDIKIGKWWLGPEVVRSIGIGLGIRLVPQLFRDKDYTLHDAIVAVHDGWKSQFGDFWAEGIVARAPLGMCTRAGERIIVKLKHADLYKDIVA